MLKTLPSSVMWTGLLLVIVLSPGCGLGTYCAKMFTWDITIYVQSSPDANENSAVQLDFILPYSKEAEAAVVKLTAAQWLAYSSQFQRDFTEGTDFGLWSYQLVPGMDVPPIQIPLAMSSRVLVVFAGYQTKGPHRYLSSTWNDLNIRLERKDFSVAEAS